MTETQTKIPGNVVTMKELDSRERKLNPFPVYRELRENTPVRFDPDRQCWDFFRYEDVRHILRDPSSFSSKRTFSANQQGSIISESLITTDPQTSGTPQSDQQSIYAKASGTTGPQHSANRGGSFGTSFGPGKDGSNLDWLPLCQSLLSPGYSVFPVKTNCSLKSGQTPSSKEKKGNQKRRFDLSYWKNNKLKPSW